MKTIQILFPKMGWLLSIFFLVFGYATGFGGPKAHPAGIGLRQGSGNFLQKSGNEPSTEIEKAKKEGKAVFLVVTGKASVGNEKALSIAKQANTKVKNTTVVQLNRDESGNRELAKKLGVANVSLPFILVISAKGVPVNGFDMTEANAEDIVGIIPSPKQDEALVAINDKKPVFFIVSRQGLTDKPAILSACRGASQKLRPNAAIVEIDIQDKREKAFLEQIGVTALEGKTKVVVAINTGQISDEYEGLVSEGKLMASARKDMKAGACCPGGSGSGCGKK